MGKKWYGVSVGHRIGVYDDYGEAVRQSSGASGNAFKGFHTYAEAERFVYGHLGFVYPRMLADREQHGYEYETEEPVMARRVERMAVGYCSPPGLKKRPLSKVLALADASDSLDEELLSPRPKKIKDELEKISQSDGEIDLDKQLEQFRNSGKKLSRASLLKMRKMLVSIEQEEEEADSSGADQRAGPSGSASGSKGSDAVVEKAAGYVTAAEVENVKPNAEKDQLYRRRGAFRTRAYILGRVLRQIGKRNFHGSEGGKPVIKSNCPYEGAILSGKVGYASLVRGGHLLGVYGNLAANPVGGLAGQNGGFWIGVCSGFMAGLCVGMLLCLWDRSEFDYVDPGLSAVEEMQRLLDRHREDNGCIPADLAISLRQSLHALEYRASSNMDNPLVRDDRSEFSRLGAMVGLEERRMGVEQGRTLRCFHSVPVVPAVHSARVPSQLVVWRGPAPSYSGYVYPWHSHVRVARPVLRPRVALGGPCLSGGRRGQFPGGFSHDGCQCPYSRPKSSVRGRFGRRGSQRNS